MLFLRIFTSLFINGSNISLPMKFCDNIFDKDNTTPNHYINKFSSFSFHVEHQGSDI